MNDASIEFEAVQDGCVQFIAPSLVEAQAFAEAHGPWAMSIYEVRRKLISRNGVAGALAPIPGEPIERCPCGYPQPCAKTTPITLCRSIPGEPK